MRFRLSSWTAVAALVLALPMAANAQTSRVEGMAIQNDYIKDYSNIFTWLSQVPNVGNIVYGELGNTSVRDATGGSIRDRGVGAVLGNLWDGRLGTWGIALRDLTPQLGEGDISSDFNPGDLGSDPNVNANQSFDLLWGRKFGGTSFGLRLNRSHGKLEGDLGDIGLGALTDVEFDFTDLTGDPNLERNTMGFGAGIGFDLNPNANIELSALYENRTFTITDSTGSTFEDDGPASYQLAARMHWQWMPNVMVVPVFKYYSFDLSTKTTGGTALDNSLKGWQAGLAGNWTLGTNDLFVLGADFAGNTAEQEAGAGIFTAFGGSPTKVSETLTPQLFAALETHVNSWLTLRFGANKAAWRNAKVQGLPGTVKLNDSPFVMNLGAGVKVGTLMVDAVVNDDFPHNLPYFVSGNSTPNVFPKVTATYTF